MKNYHLISFITLLFLSFATPVLTQNVPDVRIVSGTFLGNEKRNFSGGEAPDRLDVLWKLYLGDGYTRIGSRDSVHWKGCGWTGQPLLVKEKEDLFIIQGTYDHHLKKINAATGKLVWQYKFDDVIKGAGTIWVNKKSDRPENSVIIMQGARRGLQYSTQDPVIPSFRAISYFTGKELWRMNVRKTPSYSRDVDGSALVINDTVYAELENSTLVVFNPDPAEAKMKDSLMWPKIYSEHKLYRSGDYTRHGGNLVAESSPAKLNDHIYMAVGSGWVFGFNLITQKIDWEFYIGSDMDGSTVVTSDSCILVSVEKQYIDGPGGIFKLNPALPPDSSVVWYFQTENDSVGSWEGGVIGTAAVNDASKPEDHPCLAAFNAIDGWMYIVKHMEIDTTIAPDDGPNVENCYPAPVLVAKKRIGPSISTPVFAKDKLVSCGYGGIRLYKIEPDLKITQLDKNTRMTYESTPVVHDGKIYVGSRNGYFYCFGNKK